MKIGLSLILFSIARLCQVSYTIYLFESLFLCDQFWLFRSLEAANAIAPKVAVAKEYLSAVFA